MQGASLGAPVARSAGLPCQGALCPGSPSNRKRVHRGSFEGSSAWVPGSHGAALALGALLRDGVVHALGREWSQP